MRSRFKSWQAHHNAMTSANAGHLRSPDSLGTRITLEQENTALLSGHGATHPVEFADPLVPAAPGGGEPLRANAGLSAERSASGGLPRGPGQAARGGKPRRPGGVSGRPAAAAGAGDGGHRYKVLRILYGWLEEEEETDANPMARMKPPIVPEQPVPAVPEDGLRRLLAVCAGKGFEPAGTQPSSRCCWTPAPAAVSSPVSSSRMWTATWTCCWCSARAAASGRCRSAERRIGAGSLSGYSRQKFCL